MFKISKGETIKPKTHIHQRTYFKGERIDSTYGDGVSGAGLFVIRYFPATALTARSVRLHSAPSKKASRPHTAERVPSTRRHSDSTQAAIAFWADIMSLLVGGN